MRFFYKNSEGKNGFTIVELIVSVAIFALMTSHLVSKYGTFNQSVLLTNLAYDVALTIRNAQTYGLNVKSKPGEDSNFSDEYEVAYGVHFDTSTGSGKNRQMIFYADVNENETYTPAEGAVADEKITTYTLRGGSIISNICTGTSEDDCAEPEPEILDVLFKRPHPETIFNDDTKTYARITVQSTDGATRNIVVRRSGQIAVLQNNI